MTESNSNAHTNSFVPNASRNLMRRETLVLGLPFDVVDESQAQQIVQRAFEERTRCFLSTPNLNFAITAITDLSFRDSVRLSDLSIADGMPLIIAAKLIGERLPERVAGSSLFSNLSALILDVPRTVYFFGGDSGIAERAGNQLNATSKGLKCVGYADPGRGSVIDMSQDANIKSINNADPDFLVVALGAKKGQEWILANCNKLNARVVSHLGAVVNFVAGNIARAPSFWQKIGAEWIWRIIQEPYLYRRYASDGLKFCQILVTHIIPLGVYNRFLRSKYASQDLRVTQANMDEKNTQCIVLDGSANMATLAPLREKLTSLLSGTANIRISIEHLNYADGMTFALLLRAKTLLGQQNRKMHLVDANSRIRRLAKLYMASEYFEDL